MPSGAEAITLQTTDDYAPSPPDLAMSATKAHAYCFRFIFTCASTKASSC